MNFRTSSSFIFLISLYLSVSAFSKCLNFFCNSLNYLVILLYSPVRTLYFFLNSRFLSIYSFVNFLSLLFKLISFCLSASLNGHFLCVFISILVSYSLIFMCLKYIRLSYHEGIFLLFFHYFSHHYRCVFKRIIFCIFMSIKIMFYFLFVLVK